MEQLHQFTLLCGQHEHSQVSELRAIVAAVRVAPSGPSAAISDAKIARCVGDVCTELLGGARQTQNWVDEIVRRVVAKLSAARVQ